MFFVIALKLDELESFARTQNKVKSVLFQSTTFNTRLDSKEVSIEWALIWKTVLGKYLVNLELLQSGFTVLFINTSGKKVSSVPFTISKTQTDHGLGDWNGF